MGGLSTFARSPPKRDDGDFAMGSGVGALVALRDRFVGFGVDLPRYRADRGA